MDGKPLAELLPAEKIEELVARTRNGGAEVVALLKTGLGLLRPVGRRRPDGQGRRRGLRRGLPVCAWVDGEYGISGVYLGVRPSSAPRAYARSWRPTLTDAELAALREAAEAVRAKQADVADL